MQKSTYHTWEAGSGSGVSSSPAPVKQPWAPRGILLPACHGYHDDASNPRRHAMGDTHALWSTTKHNLHTVHQDTAEELREQVRGWEATHGEMLQELTRVNAELRATQVESRVRGDTIRDLQAEIDDQKSMLNVAADVTCQDGLSAYRTDGGSGGSLDALWPPFYQHPVTSVEVANKGISCPYQAEDCREGSAVAEESWAVAEESWDLDRRRLALLTEFEVLVTEFEAFKCESNLSRIEDLARTVRAKRAALLERELPRRGNALRWFNWCGDRVSAISKRRAWCPG